MKPINWLFHSCPAMFIWQQRSPGMKLVLFLCSFPIALHCIIPDNTSICHLALFSFAVSIFWIPPSWKPALNLVLFVFHNHLQRALEMGAGCCCSQMELVTNGSQARSPPDRNAGEQIHPSDLEVQPLAFLFTYGHPCQLLWVGGHLMEFSQEPQMCRLAHLLPHVCSQPLLARGLGGDEGRLWMVFIVMACDAWGCWCSYTLPVKPGVGQGCAGSDLSVKGDLLQGRTNCIVFLSWFLVL